MENQTKLRLLYLCQYLQKNTDPEHPVSTTQIIRELKDRYGLPVDRTTLPNDFLMMEQAGIHVEVKRSKQNLYYFDSHPFDDAELKVLIDAVSSSKFITEAKSRVLIDKLTGLTSVYRAEKLRRHLTVEGRSRSDNEKGYYIVDAVNEAIDRKCRIRFQYTTYSMNKRRVRRGGGEWYVLSPYALVWNGDYYYVTGYCDSREHTRNFRLDRIASTPQLLDDPATPPPAGFSIGDYSRRVFRMFDSDEPVRVELLCQARLMDYVIDQFGTRVKTKIVDEDHFLVTADVCPSPTFYRWVFGWGKDMKIASPASVRDAYRRMCEEALEG